MQDPTAGLPSDRASVTRAQILTIIAAWMKERNLGEPSENGTFADSGFDSLDSVELTFHLKEQLGVEIDETVLYNYPTFGALVGYVQERL
jgi:acyl carrier protein